MFHTFSICSNIVPLTHTISFRRIMGKCMGYHETQLNSAAFFSRIFELVHSAFSLRIHGRIHFRLSHFHTLLLTIFFLRSSCFLPSLALALRFARSLPFHFILHLFLPFHTSLEEHTYTGIPTNRADQAIFRIIFTFALLRIKPHDIAP